MLCLLANNHTSLLICVTFNPKIGSKLCVNLKIGSCVNLKIGSKLGVNLKIGSNYVSI